MVSLKSLLTISSILATPSIFSSSSIFASAQDDGQLSECIMLCTIKIGQRVCGKDFDLGSAVGKYKDCSCKNDEFQSRSTGCFISSKCRPQDIAYAHQLGNSNCGFTIPDHEPIFDTPTPTSSSVPPPITSKPHPKPTGNPNPPAPPKPSHGNGNSYPVPSHIPQLPIEPPMTLPNPVPITDAEPTSSPVILDPSPSNTEITPTETIPSSGTATITETISSSSSLPMKTNVPPHAGSASSSTNDANGLRLNGGAKLVIMLTIISIAFVLVL